MKPLNTYITEAKYDEPTTLYFNSLSACLLFDYEVSGQISDGYWENSRPAGHWKWIMNTEYVIDENHELGYEGPKHRIKYDCSWITRELKKSLNGTNDDYSWLSRAMNYCHAGMVANQSEMKAMTDQKNSEGLRHFLEKLPEEPITVDELTADLKDWELEYWEKAKSVITDSFLKRYYRAKYGFREFRMDLMDMEETINTQLNAEY